MQVKVGRVLALGLSLHPQDGLFMSRDIVVVKDGGRVIERYQRLPAAVWVFGRKGPRQCSAIIGAGYCADQTIHAGRLTKDCMRAGCRMWRSCCPTATGNAPPVASDPGPEVRMRDPSERRQPGTPCSTVCGGGQNERLFSAPAANSALCDRCSPLSAGLTGDEAAVACPSRTHRLGLSGVCARR